MNELSELEYKATFGPSMKATPPPEELGRIKGYLSAVLASRGGQPPPQEPKLSEVYTGSDNQYRHLLFWYGVPNVYLVVVVALAGEGESIFGHHRLDLNEQYGLPVPSDPTWWGLRVQ
jgi:hypothetical protein